MFRLTNLEVWNWHLVGSPKPSSLIRLGKPRVGRKRSIPGASM